MEGRKERPLARKSRRKGGSLCQGVLSGEERIFQSFLSTQAAGRVCGPGLKGRLSPALVSARGLLSLPGNPCSCVPRHTATPTQTPACTQSHMCARAHTHTHTCRYLTEDTDFGCFIYQGIRLFGKCLRYARCSINSVQ